MIRYNKKIKILFNPNSGNRNRNLLSSVCKWLSKWGYSITIIDTKSAEDAEEEAFKHKSELEGQLIVAGGDGTINSVVNGLNRTGGGDLAIIPTGTANVLANEINLTKDPFDIALTIAMNHKWKVHPTLINNRAFLLMAGLGFDAYITKTVDPRIKQSLGKFAYVLKTIKGLFTYTYPEFTLQIGDKKITTASALILKGKYYAGSFKPIPHGDIRHPGFNTLILENKGYVAFIRYITALLFGRLDQLSDVSVFHEKEITVLNIDSGIVETITTKGYPLFIAEDSSGNIVCISANFPGETFRSFSSREKNLFVEIVGK